MSVFLLTSSHRDHAADPAGGSSSRAARPTAGPSPTWPTSTSGTAFGTVYDVSTIAILWFAGASAMAGLLNLVPRYLPRYGMAPDWARAVRPLVLVFTVDRVPRHARSSTPTSTRRAAPTPPACWCSSPRPRSPSPCRPAGPVSARHAVAFAAIAAVFVYTTVANVVERPDGVKIGACFIAAIIAVSLVSRLRRVLRAAGRRRSSSTPMAELFVRDCAAPADPAGRQRARRPRPERVPGRRSARWSPTTTSATRTT